MEVLSVQNQYIERFSVLSGTTKPKDWSRPLQSRNDDSSTTTITTTTVTTNNKNNINNFNNTINNNNNNSNTTNNNNNTNNGNVNRNQAISTTGDNVNYVDYNDDNTILYNEADVDYDYDYNYDYDYDYDYDYNDDSLEELRYCDNIDANVVNELSLRLLDELRAAKSRNLTCTEVSIPCDLTTRIASEIMRLSEREPCGIRGCTIYIDFETEPQNTRRIGTLKVAPEMVSTFELYLTMRQDKRGWTSLLPQFMKNLSRSITISPKFSIIKHKLYSDERTSS